MFGKKSDDDKEDGLKPEDEEAYSYATLQKHQEKATMDIIHTLEDALKGNALGGLSITHNYSGNALPHIAIVITINTIAYENYLKKKASEKT